VHDRIGKMYEKNGLLWWISEPGVCYPPLAVTETGP